MLFWSWLINFGIRGYGPSGDVDFARKGFAGASQQWDCPVFGTAVFFDRAIPENWPTGVRYHSEQSVKRSSILTIPFAGRKELKFPKANSPSVIGIQFNLAKKAAQVGDHVTLRETYNLILSIYGQLPNMDSEKLTLLRPN